MPAEEDLAESAYFTFVDPGRSIPWHITRLTDELVMECPEPPPQPLP